MRIFRDEEEGEAEDEHQETDEDRELGPPPRHLEQAHAKGEDLLTKRQHCVVKSSVWLLHLGRRCHAVLFAQFSIISNVLSSRLRTIVR